MKRKEYASVLVLLVVFLIIPFLDDNLSTAWKILLVSIAVFSAGWYGYEVFWNAYKSYRQQKIQIESEIKSNSSAKMSNTELVMAYLNNELSLTQISEHAFNKKMGSKVYFFMLNQIKEMWQTKQLYITRGRPKKDMTKKRIFIPRLEKEMTLAYLNDELTLTKISANMKEKPISSRVYTTLTKTIKKMWDNKEIQFKK